MTQIRQGKHVEVYFADAGQRKYQTNRKQSVRNFKRFQSAKFIDYVVKKSQLEDATVTKVYFTHPYSAFERGTNERYNGLLRRFIPKGHPKTHYSIDDIAFIEEWCNHLPRKILGYRIPADLFEEHLDRIFAA